MRPSAAPSGVRFTIPFRKEACGLDDGLWAKGLLILEPRRQKRGEANQSMGAYDRRSSTKEAQNDAMAVGPCLTMDACGSGIVKQVPKTDLSGVG